MVKHMLKGYKTYIVAALIAGAGVLHTFGYISSEILTTVITVLTGAGLATLRSSVKDLE